METPELKYSANSFTGPTNNIVFKLDIQDYPTSWRTGADPNGFVEFGSRNQRDAFDWLALNPDRTPKQYIEYSLSPHGYFSKPAEWISRRRSPGSIQQAISEVIKARTAVAQAMDDSQGAKDELDGLIRIFQAGQATKADVLASERGLEGLEISLNVVKRSFEIWAAVKDATKSVVQAQAEALSEAMPKALIAGLAAGGDLTSAARSAFRSVRGITEGTLDALTIAKVAVVAGIESANEIVKTGVTFGHIRPIQETQERLQELNELSTALNALQFRAHAINTSLQEYDDAQRALSALIAQGDRLQAERQVVRQRSAAIVQGFRTRDAAFRIFRNEKLERYKTLFDLAARYALLAANAYDYETGLLGTPKGRAFVNRIVSSRALGVVTDGEPQYAGSNTGDPGLSSALAEMKSDWDVLRSRLGFNNPDAYSSLLSLRVEKERILPGVDGDTNWRDLLNSARRADILQDSDVRRHCLQVDSGDGLPVPGIILTFSTTISKGLNLFGQPLAAGDHAFSASSFATKIFGVGVLLDGYRGMGEPAANAGATGADGPDEPPSWFLDPQGLSATPYVYLIPVGVDSMRSPPLGDTSTIRTWSVQDLAIPLPFNLGASDFSTRKAYQSADSLTEPLFALRKHQPFRPVADAAHFALVFYADTMPRAEYVNTRLIGRSVWNSQWKLVIPAHPLLADPNEGLDRFIRTVRDIKLYLQTYSYSGN